MLNYLVMCSSPELSFLVHQCARFYNKPMRAYEQVVKRIIRNLIGTERNGTKRNETIAKEQYTRHTTRTEDTNDALHHLPFWKIIKGTLIWYSRRRWDPGPNTSRWSTTTSVSMWRMGQCRWFMLKQEGWLQMRWEMFNSATFGRTKCW